MPYGLLLFILIPFLTYISYAQDLVKACEDMFKESPKSSVLEEAGKSLFRIRFNLNKRERVESPEDVTRLVSEFLKPFGNLINKNQGTYSREDNTARQLFKHFMENIQQVIEENKNKIRIPREELVRKLNYTPSQGVYFKLVGAKIEAKKLYFRPGEYIPIILRFQALKPEPDDPVEVFYKGKLYKNGKLIGNFFDKIWLPQGEVSDLFVIPVCRGSIPGNYTLELSVSSSGITDTTRISWRIGGF